MSKLYKHNQESSSEYATESSAYEEDGAVDFSGGLKASLMWDVARKQLAVKLRQTVENTRKLEFKYTGQLNTSTGQHAYSGHLRKAFHSNFPITMQRVLEAAVAQRRGARPSDPDIDPNRLFPAGLKAVALNDWVLSPGLCFSSSSTKKVQYALTLKKAPQFIRHSPKLDCWLSGKAICAMDPRTATPSTTASLRLKMMRYGVTDKQDLQVSLGVDVGLEAGQWNKAPYLKISENNFGVKLQQKQWSLLYEL